MTFQDMLEDEREAGFAKGRAEGLKEGEVNGANSAKRELAKAFRDDGVSIEVISKRTGLSPEEIEAL